VKTILGVSAVVLGLAFASPVEAATPQVSHAQVDLSLPGIDVCGFTVDSVIQGTSTFEVSLTNSAARPRFRS
jgi:hypothetical protein